MYVNFIIIAVELENLIIKALDFTKSCFWFVQISSMQGRFILLKQVDYLIGLCKSWGSQKSCILKSSGVMSKSFN